MRKACDKFLVPKPNCLAYIVTFKDQKVIAAGVCIDILFNVQNCEWINPLTNWTQQACTKLARKIVYKWKKFERVRQDTAKKAVGKSSRKTPTKKASTSSKTTDCNNSKSFQSTKISVSVENTKQATFAPTPINP